MGCVIIDEVHPLIYHYRGIHLTHLLTRLERRNGERIQRIAMSATIAHIEDVMAAFHFRPFPDTCHIEATVKRDILARIIHLQHETVELPAFLNDLHDTWHYRKILIFANSRGACDRLFATLHRTGRFKGCCELHYSNLKPKIRKAAERRFRKQSPALCIATSTLELGIDVGDVDAVVLYEPPDSVSAFLQRIGRANRREKQLNFWGICRGEYASRQVVRFLSLLRLGRQGKVETPPRRTLPSVMAQQILSCLYEKRRISLPAISELFPFQIPPHELTPTTNHETGVRARRAVPLRFQINDKGDPPCPVPTGRLTKTALSSLFYALEKKRWLKQSAVNGLYSGGFQYGKHLTEYKIWGNFPESEEEYILILTEGHGFRRKKSTGKKNSSASPLHGTSPQDRTQDPNSIADIPQSIVNQMAIGDRVYIVGRRLKILHIDHDDHKQVVAAPTTAPPDKELIWLGKGAHVSFDVAQMMRQICQRENVTPQTPEPTVQSLDANTGDTPVSLGAMGKTDHETRYQIERERHTMEDPALFSRTRRLLADELKLESQKVILANGIEMVPGRKAPRLYRTWLGSAGNLILEWSIRNYIDQKSIFTTSHEVGVECSHAIRFEHLNLPENRKKLETWVMANLNILRNLIPLNLYCRTLPPPLLAMEIADFLFDQRVLDAFTYYLSQTSQVLSGDLSRFSRFQSHAAPAAENESHRFDKSNAINDINNAANNNPIGPSDTLKDKNYLETYNYKIFSTNEDAALHPPIPTPPSPSLLIKEKEKWSGMALPLLEKKSCMALNPSGTLTATMVSDYILYGQCSRRFCFKFLRKAPPEHSGFLKDTLAAKETAIQQGIGHEKDVLAALKAKGNELIPMLEKGSAKARFQTFLATITALIQRLSTTKPGPVLLTQALLRLEQLPMGRSQQNIPAIGVPDLIVAYMGVDEQNNAHGSRPSTNNENAHRAVAPNSFEIKPRCVMLEVGDIKSSRAPRYHHKWQVAFYAYLLQQIIDKHGIDAKVSSKGFLITRPRLTFDSSSTGNGMAGAVKTDQADGNGASDNDHVRPPDTTKHESPDIAMPINSFQIKTADHGHTIYTNHAFDLTPFITAFPVLIETLTTTLSCPVSAANHRLQRRCTTCDGFTHCYGAALRYEDVQFLPNLTPGRLLKLRKANTPMIEDIPKKVNRHDLSPITSDHGNNVSISTVKQIDDIFSSQEKEWLMGTSSALLKNQITLQKRRTRLFPANLSCAIFIHLIQDPMTGMPHALGWLITDEQFNVMETHIEIISSMKDLKKNKEKIDNDQTQSQTQARCQDQDQNHSQDRYQDQNQAQRRDAAEHQRVWRTFSERISQTWNASIGRRKGPHLFHFGATSHHTLLEWGTLLSASCDDAPDISFLWQTQPPVWCDISNICMAHFYMPLPGIPTLFTLAHLFGCDPGEAQMTKPSLFHEEGIEVDEKLTNHGTPSVDDNIGRLMNANLNTMASLLKKIHPSLESRWINGWEKATPPTPDKVLTQLIREERRLHEEDILDLQELPLIERMDRFRSLGYLRFQGTQRDHQRRMRYLFSTTPKTRPGKFRKGDFLKLVPHGMVEIQSGDSVIIDAYDMERGELALISRSGRLQLNGDLLFSLEEDADDFTEAKLTHVSEYLFSESLFHPVHPLLSGKLTLSRNLNADHDNLTECLNPKVDQWLRRWLQLADPGLNAAQEAALKLPFQHRIFLIQGPPGTGKTHLLGWILVALVMQAFERGVPLRIGVSALTHQAIDNVLAKVVTLINGALPQCFPRLAGQNFPATCIKWGKKSDEIQDKRHSMAQILQTDDADAVLKQTWSIIGATGFGFYNLFNSKSGEFPAALDWVIFDEASQVLLPQALMALVYGKGHFLFLGDVHQLPPIVRGNYGPLERSILETLMARYPDTNQMTLDTTYRMNKEICTFPSKMWYDGLLHSAPSVANAHLAIDINTSDDFPTKNQLPTQNQCREEPEVNSPLSAPPFMEDEPKGESTGREITPRFLNSILDPSKPLALILCDHTCSAQQSDMEAELMATMACRLMTQHHIAADDMAIISPHRAQNNAIMTQMSEMVRQFIKGNEESSEKGMKPLALPLVDTVERMQGAERDVILFGLTVSDLDHIQSEFLNSPNRLNVAMTRAKKKLVIVGSKAFFSAIPTDEAMLARHHCFKALLAYCKKENALFCF